MFFNIWVIIKKMKKLLTNAFYSFTEIVGIIYNKIIDIKILLINRIMYNIHIYAKLKMYFHLYLHK